MQDNFAVMQNCILQELPDGRWWCPACDPKGEHSLSVNARRNCPKTTPREAVLDELWNLALLNITQITHAELSTRLTNCETCRRFLGNGCDRYKGCSERRKWLELLGDGARECKAREPLTGESECVGSS